MLNLRAFGLLVVTSLAFSALACSSTSSNPTEDQAITRVAPAACQRWQECAPITFAAAFDAGASDCVARLRATETTPNKAAGCTSSQLDTCVTDTQNQACKISDETLVAADGGAALGADIVQLFAPSCGGC